MGRNLFRNWGFTNWDLSIFKSFSIKERYLFTFLFSDTVFNRCSA